VVLRFTLWGDGCARQNGGKQQYVLRGVAYHTNIYFRSALLSGRDTKILLASKKMMYLGLPFITCTSSNSRSSSSSSNSSSCCCNSGDGGGSSSSSSSSIRIDKCLHCIIYQCYVTLETI